MKDILVTVLSLFATTLFAYVKAEESIDAYWMNYINENLKLNEINIPGTHNSGTFNIDKSPDDLKIVSLFKNEYGKTQNLNISDQLLNGIRYLDIRLASDDYDNIYISHGKHTCYNDNHEGLYLTEVLNDCVNFLINHPSETIIIHLKYEYLTEYVKLHLGQIIADMTVLNTTPVTSFSKYSDYFYKGKDIPTLALAKSKIVFVTKELYGYGDEYQLGTQIFLPDMGACRNYNYNESLCYPRDNGSGIYRIQDAYNLDGHDKWKLVRDVLTYNVPTAFVESFEEEEKYKITILGKKEYALTLNFLNMARAQENPLYFFLDLFDSSIEQSACYINTELAKFTTDKYRNEWIILDYPSKDVIRKIYQSNDPSNPYLTQNKVDSLDIFSDAKYYLSKIPFVDFLDIFRRDGRNENTENTRICYQLKSKTDEHGNQYYDVKTDSKCINNSKNQWYIKQNGKYYNFVSAFNGQCIIYSEDGTLRVDKCNKTNRYKDFIIENNVICSSVDKTKCLEGTFNTLPVTLESKKYENLTCSTKFAKFGYQCCSECIDIEYENEIGRWGFEDNRWCGIPYDCPDNDSDSDGDEEETDGDDVQVVDDDEEFQEANDIDDDN
eukprot:jgi/Orpsp1_1/1186062/evm.model.c7180000096705.1